MRTYIPNNIKFRVVSSNAIAKFKSAQAFDFHEILKEQNRFQEPTREVLLLEYDYWFKFILRLERLYLALHEHEPTDNLLRTVVFSTTSILEEIEEIITCHFEIFSHPLSKYIQSYHVAAVPVFVDEIKKLLNDTNIYTSFPQIVNTVSMFLQQFMFILHDYDNNVLSKRDAPFLSFTQIASDTLDMFDAEHNTHPFEVRAHFFKNEFGINTFNIKNYSSRDANSIKDIVKTRQICEIGEILNLSK